MKGDRKRQVIGVMSTLKQFTARQLADLTQLTVKNVSWYLIFGQRQSLLSLDKETGIYTVLPSADLKTLVVSRARDHRKPKDKTECTKGCFGPKCPEGIQSNCNKPFGQAKTHRKPKITQDPNYFTKIQQDLNDQAKTQAQIQNAIYRAESKPVSKMVLPPLPSINLEDLKVRATSLPEYVRHLEDGWIKERKDHADLRCWVDRTLRKMPDPCSYRLPMEAKL